jgi:hypothetical protein
MTMLNDKCFKTDDIGFKTQRLISLALGLALCGCISTVFAFDNTAAMESVDDTSAAPAASSTTAPIAADPAHLKDWDKVLQLGEIQVQGDREEISRKIIAGLKVVKRALTANLSNDPAHADDIICRVNYDTGSHLMAHLRCATNRILSQERDAIQIARLTHGTGQANGSDATMLENLEGVAPSDRFLSTHVNATELQKLLLIVQCDGCSNSGLVVGNN